MTKAMDTRNLLGDLLTDSAAILAERMAEGGRLGTRAAATAFILTQKDSGKCPGLLNSY